MIGLWVLVLLAFTPGPRDPWLRQVERAADSAAAGLAAEGYRREGELLAGSLLLEESTDIPVTLDHPGQYALVGVCDRDCSALDLVIITATRYELDADRSGTPRPIVRAPAREPGRYVVRVTMAGCRVAPCRYGVVLLRKGG